MYEIPERMYKNSIFAIIHIGHIKMKHINH